MEHYRWVHWKAARRRSNKVTLSRLSLQLFLHPSSLDLAKQVIANKKKISFEEAKRLDKSNESMPPWQQLHASSGLTSGIGSSGTASSNSGSSSPRVVTASQGVVLSSPVNTLADASSSVTTNLLMDSTNTNGVTSDKNLPKTIGNNPSSSNDVKRKS